MGISDRLDGVCWVFQCQQLRRRTPGPPFRWAGEFYCTMGEVVLQWPGYVLTAFPLGNYWANRSSLIPVTVHIRCHNICGNCLIGIFSYTFYSSYLWLHIPCTFLVNEPSPRGFWTLGCRWRGSNYCGYGRYRCRWWWCRGGGITICFFLVVFCYACFFFFQMLSQQSFLFCCFIGIHSNFTRCCRSNWPGLCLFCCSQPLCVVSFGLRCFINFPILQRWWDSSKAGSGLFVFCFCHLAFF